MSEIAIRPGRDSDRACVYSTWLHSYRHGSHFPRRIPEKTYFAEQHDLIQAILDSPTTTLLMAVPSDDPDVILGWACFERGVGAGEWEIKSAVHYVYVKPAFRRSGVASQLLSSLGEPDWVYTHDTFVLRLPAVGAKLRQAFFNPYRAMRAMGAR